ncbi:MAG: hypothetical protein ACD_41C00385G0003 [uncultured bacterium]|nr:MAG: hypothetical protein ACD_41C00385G0003 [uncultured bacterium]
MILFSNELALGIKVYCFTIHNLHNRVAHPDFEIDRLTILKELLAKTTAAVITNDPMLQGFRDLHTAVGKSNRRFVSSPENLLQTLLRTSTLPSINLLVDIYNLVSVQTHLALGAHDISQIAGHVALRLTNGTERYQALGKSQPEPVPAGEYAYIDDSNEIICRLECRQVEKTKITSETTGAFFIVQGNPNTTDSAITSGRNQLISLVQKYCGGTVALL